MRTALHRLLLAAISVICFLSFSHNVRANTILRGIGYSHVVKTDGNDSSLVLQACIDMPELQSLYPKDAGGNYKPVYIMQYPVVFQQGLTVSKFQQGVVYESRADIYNNKREAFFIVKSFLVSGDTATVVFDYNYNYTTTPAALEVTLTLQKTGADWSITNTITSQR